MYIYMKIQKAPEEVKGPLQFPKALCASGTPWVRGRKPEEPKALEDGCGDPRAEERRACPSRRQRSGRDGECVGRTGGRRREEGTRSPPWLVLGDFKAVGHHLKPRERRAHGLWH